MSKKLVKQVSLKTKFAILFACVIAVLTAIVLGFNAVSQVNSNAFADGEDTNVYNNVSHNEVHLGFLTESADLLNRNVQFQSNLDSDSYIAFCMFTDFGTKSCLAFYVNEYGADMVYLKTKTGVSADSFYDEQTQKVYKLKSWKYKFNAPATPGETLSELDLDGSKTNIPADATALYVYPSYEEAQTISVTFDGNGGKWNDQTTYKALLETVGDNYTFPPENPAKEEATFSGWFTGRTDGTEVTSETIVKQGDATTLYAHWEEDKKIIPFNAVDQYGNDLTDGISFLDQNDQTITEWEINTTDYPFCQYVNDPSSDESARDEFIYSELQFTNGTHFLDKIIKPRNSNSTAKFFGWYYIDNNENLLLVDSEKDLNDDDVASVVVMWALDNGASPVKNIDVDVNSDIAKTGYWSFDEKQEQVFEEILYKTVSCINDNRYKLMFMYYDVPGWGEDGLFMLSVMYDYTGNWESEDLEDYPVVISESLEINVIDTTKRFTGYFSDDISEELNPFQPIEIDLASAPSQIVIKANFLEVNPVAPALNDDKYGDIVAIGFMDQPLESIDLLNRLFSGSVFAEFTNESITDEESGEETAVHGLKLWDENHGTIEGPDEGELGVVKLYVQPASTSNDETGIFDGWVANNYAGILPLDEIRQFDQSVDFTAFYRDQDQNTIVTVKVDDDCGMPAGAKIALPEEIKEIYSIDDFQEITIPNELIDDYLCQTDFVCQNADDGTCVLGYYDIEMSNPEVRLLLTPADYDPEEIQFDGWTIDYGQGAQPVSADSLNPSYFAVGNVVVTANFKPVVVPPEPEPVNPDVPVPGESENINGTAQTSDNAPFAALAITALAGAAGVAFASRSRKFN